MTRKQKKDTITALVVLSIFLPILYILSGWIIIILAGGISVCLTMWQINKGVTQ